MGSTFSSENQQQNSVTKKTLNSIISGVNIGENLIGSENVKNCFELRTNKRTYYFCASSPKDAYKWIKQIETCCLDS